jgi:ABC-type nickel/cobalt efflux system permease component RcnA
MKTKYSTWDWINVLVFPIAYIILMSGFFIFTSEIRLIKFFFTAGLLLTLLSIAHSAIYFKNYIDNRTNKKGRFESNIWTLLGLVTIMTIYLQLTIYFHPLGLVFY